MSIVINWIMLQSPLDNLIEIPYRDAVLAVYSAKNVITNTEWRELKEADKDKLIEVNSLGSDIQQYFTNPVATLTVNLKMQGTAFRHKVWAEICKIPVGETLTYSALAVKIDSGARAVANACRDNPYPGIIPCHRVVAVSGLGGYMGQSSGKLLDIKQGLLTFEAMLVSNENCLKEHAK